MQTLALALVLAPQTFVVDAGGGGDFTTIQAAIDASSDGDVLLIQPGEYLGFLLDKELSLLGPASGPAPVVISESTIQGAAGFTLSGLTLPRMTISAVAGHGEIDRCTVLSPSQWGVALYGCDRIQIERSVIEVETNFYYSSGPRAAVYASDSDVTLVECQLRGGDSASGMDYDAGGAGLWATTSNSLVVNTGAQGGVGGTYSALFTFCEPGGHGFVAEGGQLVLRGSGTAAAGGPGGFGCADGTSIYALAGAHVLVGGYETPDGLLTLSGGAVQATTGEPFLTLLGQDGPGTARRLRIAAEVGDAVIVVGSVGSAHLAVPGLEGLVGVDPAQIFFTLPVSGTGLLAPQTVQLPLPASFAGLSGLSVHFQGVAPAHPGTLNPSDALLTNPVTLALGF